MMNDQNLPESPCQRKCCLDDNDICLGCFRSLEEIIGWSHANKTERLDIIKRAQDRKEEKKRSSPWID